MGWFDNLSIKLQNKDSNAAGKSEAASHPSDVFAHPSDKSLPNDHGRALGASGMGIMEAPVMPLFADSHESEFM